MRALVLLCLICLTLVGGVWFATDLFYLGPLRLADERITSLIEQRDAFRARERRARQDLAALPPVARGADPIAEHTTDIAASGARFQESMRNAVSAVGGLATSSQTVQSDAGQGFSKLSVLLRARFDEKGLLSFLRDAESAQPVILVDSLDIRLTPLSGSTLPLDVTATMVKFHADIAAP